MIFHKLAPTYFPAYAVSSARAGLTSVFEMGTGVSPLAEAPENESRRISRVGRSLEARFPSLFQMVIEILLFKLLVLGSIVCVLRLLS